MAKSPGEIDKTRRIQVLKDIIMRWGTLDKNQAQELLEKALDVESGSFSRSIYRDLEHLVNHNMILVEYFTKDGAPLSSEDIESGAVKSYKSRWSSIDSKNKVRGEKILNTYGGSLYCPRVLINELSVTDSNVSSKLKQRNIYFNLGAHFLSLNISLDSIPCKIVVSRMVGEITTDIVEMIESAHGKRAALLRLPIADISSTKSVDQSGHFVIEIENKETITLRDLKSKNGTKVYRITVEDGEEMISRGGAIGKETLTEGWNKFSPESLIEEEIETSEFQLPILVKASEKGQFLVF